MNPAAATAQVTAQIHGLYHDFANTRAHSAWLEAFQQAPEAWAVVHELLTTSSEEVVLYIAAHTLVTKLQAGHLPAIGAGALQQELVRYLARFYRGPPTVRRQIVVALVDFALWQPASEDGNWLTGVVQPLMNTVDAVPCLLELLQCIPEEAINRKVVVEPSRRLSFAINMQQHTNRVLDTLCNAYQSNAADPVSVLRTFARWLNLQNASPQLRAQKKGGSGAPFTCELIKSGGLHENPLIMVAAQALSSIVQAPVELVRAAVDALSEAKALTNESSLPARPLLLLVMRAVVAGSEVLLRMPEANVDKCMMPDTDFSQRAAALGRLVSELGTVFAHLVVQDGKLIAASTADPSLAAPPPMVLDSAPVLQSVSEVARQFYTLRHVDLARCGVDFWYAVLAKHLGAAAEEDDPFAQEPPPVLVSLSRQTNTAWATNPQTIQAKRAEDKPFLEPHIQNMVKASMQATRFPAEPDQEEYFEWDEFCAFREVCNINITEACTVVTPSWIIDHVGTVLQGICARPIHEIQWQEIDACVFMLTGVASRAPAGKDTVIPKLLEMLPQLPYPSTGFKATLMRCAASRLVLFTSGYLALHEVPCKNTLRFLATDHLPAIPVLPKAPDEEARQYCQSLACEAVKMVMTSANKVIVAADAGNFWREVVQRVISSVLDARLTVDGRAQLVFGIGQVLGALQNWTELEAMLGLFVSRMQEPLMPLLANLPQEPDPANARVTTSDGKAPVNLKLYVAALSCVYNIPQRSKDVPRPDHHPVLAVLEKNFPVIERICLHHTHYEDLMEQMCLAFSYILGYTREYAVVSPILVSVMRLMAKCCDQHPQPCYMGMVRSWVGCFAALENSQTSACLVDLTGLFVGPIARKLATAAPGEPLLSPPVNAAAFEMLADTVRHWNLALMSIQQAAWFTETLCNTLEGLPRLAEENQVIHERTVCAMLRFLRNILLWGDQEMKKDERMVDLVAEAQRVVNERPLPRGGTALSRIMSMVARLLAAAATNNPAQGQVVPVVAEVLFALFSGPFDYVISSQFPTVIRSLPSPLGPSISELELKRLVQQLKMERTDKNRFIRSVIGLAEQFAVTLKRAKGG